MTSTRRAIRTAVLTLALGAPGVAALGFAQPARAADAGRSDAMPSSYAKMMKMKPKEVMKMMGPDEKGMVSREKFMKFHEQMFDKLDRNKDGMVDAQEFLADSGG
jgi:hypothetical protein